MLAPSLNKYSWKKQTQFNQKVMAQGSRESAH
jgi:hypothetical protein